MTVSQRVRLRYLNRWTGDLVEEPVRHAVARVKYPCAACKGQIARGADFWCATSGSVCFDCPGATVVGRG